MGDRHGLPDHIEPICFYIHYRTGRLSAWVKFEDQEQWIIKKHPDGHWVTVQRLDGADINKLKELPQPHGGKD